MLETQRAEDGTFDVKVRGTLEAGWHVFSANKHRDSAVELKEALEPGHSVVLEASSFGAGGEVHTVRIWAEAADLHPDDHDEDEEDVTSGQEFFAAKSGAIETKRMGGHIVETKVEDRNGVRVGIVAGYIATWAPDTGGVFGVPDQFVRGAFLESLADHRARGNRQVRLKDHHGRTIGGYPIDTVFEDEVGLFGRGEINLETQAGREAFSLAKQGVLVDFSVGFTALFDGIEAGIRFITKAILWEGSVVDEPANQGAQILEVKTRSFGDLPLAKAGTTWDAEAAALRVGKLEDSAAARAFLIEGKLAIADVVDGTLVVVPEALRQAVARVQQSRPGVDISPQERKAAVGHLERYFAKMGEDSPFAREERKFWGAEEAKTMTAHELENALSSTENFSRAAARVVSSRLTAAPGSVYAEGETKGVADLLASLRGAIGDVKQG